MTSSHEQNKDTPDHKKTTVTWDLLDRKLKTKHFKEIHWTSRKHKRNNLSHHRHLREAEMILKIWNPGADNTKTEWTVWYKAVTAKLLETFVPKLHPKTHLFIAKYQHCSSMWMLRCWSDARASLVHMPTERTLQPTAEHVPDIHHYWHKASLAKIKSNNQWAQRQVI